MRLLLYRIYFHFSPTDWFSFMQIFISIYFAVCPITSTFFFSISNAIHFSRIQTNMCTKAMRINCFSNNNYSQRKIMFDDQTKTNCTLSTSINKLFPQLESVRKCIRENFRWMTAVRHTIANAFVRWIPLNVCMLSFVILSHEKRASNWSECYCSM